MSDLFRRIAELSPRRLDLLDRWLAVRQGLTAVRHETRPALADPVQRTSSDERHPMPPEPAAILESDPAKLLERIDTLSEDDVDALLESMAGGEGAAPRAPEPAPTPVERRAHDDISLDQLDAGALLGQIDTLTDDQVDLLLAQLTKTS